MYARLCQLRNIVAASLKHNSPSALLVAPVEAIAAAVVRVLNLLAIVKGREELDARLARLGRLVLQIPDVGRTARREV